MQVFSLFLYLNFNHLQTKAAQKATSADLHHVDFWLLYLQPGKETALERFPGILHFNQAVGNISHQLWEILPRTWKEPETHLTEVTG